MPDPYAIKPTGSGSLTWEVFEPEDEESPVAAFRSREDADRWVEARDLAPTFRRSPLQSPALLAALQVSDFVDALLSPLRHRQDEEPRP
jgi:hypothetical protein